MKNEALLIAQINKFKGKKRDLLLDDFKIMEVYLI